MASSRTPANAGREESVWIASCFSSAESLAYSAMMRFGLSASLAAASARMPRRGRRCRKQVVQQRDDLRVLRIGKQRDSPRPRGGILGWINGSLAQRGDCGGIAVGQREHDAASRMSRDVLALTFANARTNRPGIATVPLPA
jgi:hypothetical protein